MQHHAVHANAAGHPLIRCWSPTTGERTTPSGDSGGFGPVGHRAYALYGFGRAVTGVREPRQGDTRVDLQLR